jgi:serine/threonine protein kinase
MIKDLLRGQSYISYWSHLRGALHLSAGALQQLKKGSQEYAFLAPPQCPDELGRLGPYRVLEVLGAGGMGVVFRAEDPQLMRPVALKAMLPAMAERGDARQRFLREARAAAGISHDHIITVYQVGEDGGVPYLAMQYLNGETLDKHLDHEGSLSVAEVIRIGREIALGLSAAHQRYLIHRDIKPANIWLERQLEALPSAWFGGRVKLLDFGLARAVGEEGQLTQLGGIVGTPAYMAPEQAQGKGVDARADLFSLGCVLYRMATGKAPFSGADVVSTLMAVATHDPPPPHELNGRFPKAVSQLIMKLLAKEVANRPASATEVAEALNRLARELAEQPTTPGASAGPPRERPSGPRPSPAEGDPSAQQLSERRRLIQQETLARRLHEFDRQMREERWSDAAGTLDRLRLIAPADTRSSDCQARLAQGLRSLLFAKPEELPTRQLYLQERTPELRDDDERAGRALGRRILWGVVLVCIVLFPLLLLLPTLIRTLNRMAPARRFCDLGPLPLRALLLDERELARRYRPGGPNGPYDEGFSQLRM